MNKVRIENWSVRAALLSPYMAPELAVKQLIGQVFGHPHFEDGKVVTTSAIQSHEGKKVQTKNTTYVLGEVDPEYKDWLVTNNIVFNPEEPLRYV